MAHLIAVVAATALITLCTLLPFLPGRYDRLAVPLSAMSLVLGKAGLMLVPLGALWLALGRDRRPTRTHGIFRAATLVAASVIWLAVSLSAAVFGGISLGIVLLLAGVSVVLGVASRLRPLSDAPRSAWPVALHLVAAPIAVILLQTATVDRAVEFSRRRAIQNSERLIRDIEQYRAVYGRYPPSLLSVNTDYSPGVIGIERFHYEPHGEAYNVLFEQFTPVLDTREFVVYNPRSQQVMTSHDMDLLQFTGRELELRRGYYAVHEGPHSSWKYYRFD